MSPLTLLAAAVTLFWLNTRSYRQPNKAITFYGGWFLLVFAVAMVFLGVSDVRQIF